MIGWVKGSIHPGYQVSIKAKGVTMTGEGWIPALTKNISADGKAWEVMLLRCCYPDDRFKHIIVPVEEIGSYDIACPGLIVSPEDIRLRDELAITRNKYISEAREKLTIAKQRSQENKRHRAMESGQGMGKKGSQGRISVRSSAGDGVVSDPIVIKQQSLRRMSAIFQAVGCVVPQDMDPNL
jgi:hypothetical protein